MVYPYRQIHPTKKPDSKTNSPSDSHESNKDESVKQDDANRRYSTPPPADPQDYGLAVLDIGIPPNSSDGSIHNTTTFKTYIHQHDENSGNVSYMLNHRNDNPERKKRYTHEGSKWSKSVLNYRINNIMTHGSMSQKEVKEALDMAWKVWADVIPIRFRGVRPDEYADIEIEFHSYFHYDNYPFDGRGKTLAHAFYPRWGGDVHFDNDEDWSTETKSGIQFIRLRFHVSLFM